MTTPSTPIGQKTRIIDALYCDFKKYWEKNKCWPPLNDIIQLAISYTSGDRDEAIGLLSFIAYKNGTMQLRDLLIKKGISQDQLDQFFTGNSATIGAMLNTFRYLLSPTTYEEQPFFNLMTLIQNAFRHPDTYLASIPSNTVPPAESKPATNLTHLDKQPSLTPDLLLKYLKEANEYYAVAQVASTNSEAFKYYHCACDSYEFLVRQNFDVTFCAERIKIIKPLLQNLQQNLTETASQLSAQPTKPFKFSSPSTSAALGTFFSTPSTATNQKLDSMDAIQLLKASNTYPLPNQYPPANYQGEERKKEIDETNNKK
jgi:hypothetical protein